MSRYTSEQVSEAYKFSLSTIRLRARLLGISPIVFDGIKQYLFTQNEVLDIVNYGRKTPKIPSVIYVHTIWEVRESKLNFM
jgi:hypothetical protein